MPSLIPNKIAAGASLKWTIRGGDYPAPTWALSLHLRGPDVIDLTATADGSDHLIAASAATSAGWSAGAYAYAVRVTDGADVWQLERGEIEIEGDLTAALAGADHSTHAQRVLAAIDAILEDKATLAQQSYTINGRTLMRRSTRELMALRQVYSRKVAREKARARGDLSFSRPINVEF